MGTGTNTVAKPGQVQPKVRAASAPCNKTPTVLAVPQAADLPSPVVAQAAHRYARYPHHHLSAEANTAVLNAGHPETF